MSRENVYQITGWQAAALTAACTSFGIRTTVSGFSGSWLASKLVCTAVLALVVFFTMSTLTRSGTSSLTSAVSGSFGRIIGSALLAAIGVYFVIQASIMLAQRAETISMFLLPNTPKEVVLFAAVLTSGTIFFMGLRQLASTAELVTLLLLVPIAVLLVLGLSGIDPNRLRPLASGGFDSSAAMLSARTFHGFEIFVFCLGAKRLSSKDANKLWIAYLFCAVCSIIAFLICVGTFSANGANGLAYPLNEAYRVLNIGNITLSERFDLLLLLIDLIGGLVSAAAFMYCACICLGSTFRLDSHRSAVFCVLPAVLLLSYAITRGAAGWTNTVADIGFAFIMLVILPLICIVIRAKGGSNMRLRLAALTALSLFILTGCWDMRELNSRVFILGIGIDTSDSGGYDFTFYSTDGKSFSVTTLNADSLAPAVRDFEERNSNTIDLEHLSCVALGMDVAQDNFMPLLEYLYRWPGVRRQCQIAAVEPRAADLFADTSDNAASAAATLLESFDSSQGGQPLVSLHTLYIAEQNGEGKYIYRMNISEDQTQITGILSYDEQGYTGDLSMDQTEQSLFFVNGQTKGLITCAYIDDEPDYYSVSSSYCDRKVTLSADGLAYAYMLDITVRLVDGSSDVPANTAQSAIEEQMSLQLTELARYCASLGGEVIGMQSDARTQLSSWYEQNRGDFKTQLARSIISVDVNCTIEGSGVAK